MKLEKQQKLNKNEYESYVVVVSRNTLTLFTYIHIIEPMALIPTLSRPKPGYMTGARERKSYTLPEPVASL